MSPTGWKRNAGLAPFPPCGRCSRGRARGVALEVACGRPVPDVVRGAAAGRDCAAQIRAAERQRARAPCVGEFHNVSRGEGRGTGPRSRNWTRRRVPPRFPPETAQLCPSVSFRPQAPPAFSRGRRSPSPSKDSTQPKAIGTSRVAIRMLVKTSQGFLPQPESSVSGCRPTGQNPLRRMRRRLFDARNRELP
jgi:hypothetical protein